MRRLFFSLFTLLICVNFLGCAATQKQQAPVEAVEENQPAEESPPAPEEKKSVPEPDAVPELENIEEEDLVGYIEKKGIVFAKTDFREVLETSYVKLLLKGTTEENNRAFQLHIGEPKEDAKFLWDAKTVQPGYFFIELPAGAYKISSVSIPVGSTLATEPIDISFDVTSDTITYIGTLKIIGTKEKIKLGGVPLIRPGFEYKAEIVDEREEAIKTFRQRYPLITSFIKVRLMKLKEPQPQDQTQAQAKP